MNKNLPSSDYTRSLEEDQLQLEAFRKNKISLLQKNSDHFFSTTSLITKIGVELEFYLTNQDRSRLLDQLILADFIAELSRNIPVDSLIYKIEKEQGVGQIEVKTIFDSDLLKVCDEIKKIKSAAKNLALQKNLIASFAAQEFPDDCGSALQFNISLHDARGKNLFESDEKILQKVASGLLQMTNSMMIFLAPNEDDYARFSGEINRNLFKQGKFTAPVNLSFGADNRTCAIRIPVTPKNSENNFGKRLEYRIAAADADPFLAMSAILLAMIFGIENGEPQLSQLHGNAFDEQYGVQNFCKNLEEAREKFFEKGNFIRGNFLDYL